ncbi:hypothetical protein BJ170DRAFT_359566 [Xylariales sp. AK1849]|nr:hypothetical protein BJ170DRAFT_359566 [Xylariales sp. AK1849]
MLALAPHGRLEIYNALLVPHGHSAKRIFRAPAFSPKHKITKCSPRPSPYSSPASSPYCPLPSRRHQSAAGGAPALRMLYRLMLIAIMAVIERMHMIAGFCSRRATLRRKRFSFWPMDGTWLWSGKGSRSGTAHDGDELRYLYSGDRVGKRGYYIIMYGRAAGPQAARTYAVTSALMNIISHSVMSFYRLCREIMLTAAGTVPLAVQALSDAALRHMATRTGPLGKDQKPIQRAQVSDTAHS